MSTPSRATVITASVAIGVFGAGTAVGTVIATGSQPADLNTARLIAGTYRLDDGADAWTSLASDGTGGPSSLSGADAGSTITAGSGKQRVCLATTTDGRAVNAAADGCTSLPVLAASQFAALRRPANPKVTGTPEPKSTPESKPKSTPKETAKKTGTSSAPRPTAKAATKPPVVTAAPTRAPAATTAPPVTTKTIGATAAPSPTQGFVTVTATPVATASAAPVVTSSAAKGSNDSKGSSGTNGSNGTKVTNGTASGSPAPSPAAQWGKVIGTTQNGTRLVERADGSRAIFGPDNKLIRVMPGPWATGVKVLPDGNWLLLRPNGDRMIVSPAGQELAPQQNTATPTPSPAAAAGTGTGTAGAAGATGNGTTGTTGGTGTGSGGATGGTTGTTGGTTGTTGAGGTTGTTDTTTGSTITGGGGTSTGTDHGDRHRTRHGGEHRAGRDTRQGGAEGGAYTGTATGGSDGSTAGGAAETVGGAADGTAAGAVSGDGTGAGAGTGTGTEAAGDGGTVSVPGADGSLPVLQDPALLQQASEALGLDQGRSYTDENGVWDLNIAPPGTPACRDYSSSELSRRGIPRDSCALPAFVRWLYADPAPGQVSNWTKFTGLPERNLELVVMSPSAMPSPAGEPGRIEPDTTGYAGS